MGHLPSSLVVFSCITQEAEPRVCNPRTQNQLETNGLADNFIIFPFIFNQPNNMYVYWQINQTTRQGCLSSSSSYRKDKNNLSCSLFICNSINKTQRRQRQPSLYGLHEQSKWDRSIRVRGLRIQITYLWWFLKKSTKKTAKHVSWQNQQYTDVRAMLIFHTFNMEHFVCYKENDFPILHW